MILENDFILSIFAEIKVRVSSLQETQWLRDVDQLKYR